MLPLIGVVIEATPSPVWLFYSILLVLSAIIIFLKLCLFIASYLIICTELLGLRYVLLPSWTLKLIGRAILLGEMSKLLFRRRPLIVVKVFLFRIMITASRIIYLAWRIRSTSWTPVIRIMLVIGFNAHILNLRPLVFTAIVLLLIILRASIMSLWRLISFIILSIIRGIMMILFTLIIIQRPSSIIILLLMSCGVWLLLSSLILPNSFLMNDRR